MLREINGFATRDMTDKDGKPTYKAGQHLKAFVHLTDDGATACGNWIMTGVFPEEGKNLAARRERPKGDDYLAHNWGFVWPANRRILYNRTSADPSGKPWSERKKLIWWDPEAPGATPGQEGQVGRQGRAGLRRVHPARRAAGQGRAAQGDRRDRRVHHAGGRQGRALGLRARRRLPGALRALRVTDEEPALEGAEQPRGQGVEDRRHQPARSPDKYPYILTTYRLTEHHAAGTSRHVPWLSELFPGHFAEIGVEMAKDLGIANGDMITVETPRGKIKVRAMVTERIKPFVIDGKKVYQVGIPWHWGWAGVMQSSRGDITNDLVASVGDPTTFIQESKALLCNVRKGVA